MEIITFRAKTMQQALDQVRHDLGPGATVLHTREVNGDLIRRLVWGRHYEIAASRTLQVPSRLPPLVAQPLGEQFHQPQFHQPEAHQPISELPGEQGLVNRTMFSEDGVAVAGNKDSQQNFAQEPAEEVQDLQTLVEQLRRQSGEAPRHEWPASLFSVFTDMIQADVQEEVARELVERLREVLSDYGDVEVVRRQLIELLADELVVTGPIDTTKRNGRIVALVGPTGVGKTTTIAKLAANYRLRENKRIGLITVDTYRIAAVEQLRTYADIIDLPMEVVSTPREMREAIDRMRDLDLVLMDTAGRSPRDEVRIRELKALLAEAKPDEVHLVLSAVGSATSMAVTAQRFATVGTSALLVTKLDEAMGLGSLLSVARNSHLPISYLTDGQNVPDDIRVAKKKELAQLILGTRSEE
ncbi:MAG: flagellar biosynthesis protein FlhF [Pirellulales bacterium]